MQPGRIWVQAMNYFASTINNYIYTYILKHDTIIFEIFLFEQNWWHYELHSLKMSTISHTCKRREMQLRTHLIMTKGDPNPERADSSQWGNWACATTLLRELTRLLTRCETAALSKTSPRRNFNLRQLFNDCCQHAPSTILSLAGACIASVRACIQLLHSIL